MRDLQELHAAIDSHESTECDEFAKVFLAVCSEPGSSRANAHIFVLLSESLELFDPASFIRAAQQARITLHAFAGRHHKEIREVCRATGGFYMTDADDPDSLSALYRGISRRYQALLSPDVEVHSVQIAVRTAEGSGESPIVDVKTP